MISSRPSSKQSSSGGLTFCCRGRTSLRITRPVCSSAIVSACVPFNDDVQGTAAVATGTLLAAINVTGVPLTEQRIAIPGAGSAGCGIASLIRKAMMHAGLQESEVAHRFFMVDRDGLLVEGMDGIASFQQPFLQTRSVVESWTLEHRDRIALLDVVRNAKPSVLIGVSGQAGAFSEPVVRAMAEHNKRPVIFLLSNPSSRAEATPEDLETWAPAVRSRR